MFIFKGGCSYDYIRGQRSRSMHRASQFSNTGQCPITIIVTNRGGQCNRKKCHLRLFNSIRISLFPSSVKNRILTTLKQEKFSSQFFILFHNLVTKKLQSNPQHKVKHPMCALWSTFISLPQLLWSPVSNQVTFSKKYSILLCYLI